LRPRNVLIVWKNPKNCAGIGNLWSSKYCNYTNCRRRPFPSFIAYEKLNFKKKKKKKE